MIKNRMNKPASASMTIAVTCTLLLFIPTTVNAQDYPPLTPAQEQTMNEVTGLLQQANRLEDDGEYDQAEVILKQSLALAEKIGGPDHVAVTFSLNNLADLYKARGDLDQAEQLHLRALAIRERVLGPAHKDIVFSLNNLSEIYQEKGDIARAVSLSERAVAMSELKLGPDSTVVAMSLSNLATAYQARGEFGRTEPLLLRVVAIREKSLGPDHPDVAVALNNLAHLYGTIGQYEKVEPLQLRALRIFEKAYGSDNLNIAILLNNMGEQNREMGEYAKAEPLYQRAIRIIEKILGPETLHLATPLSNLSVLYQTMGDPVRAEQPIRRAIAIVEKALGPNVPALVAPLANLATIYQATDELDKAEQTYKRAMAIAEVSPEAQGVTMAMLLKNMGDLYNLKRDTARAVSTYEKALLTWDKALPQDNPQIAPTLNNLGLLYTIVEDFKRAEPLYKRALAIEEKAFGPNHPAVALTLSNLGLIYAATGDIPKAVSFFSRSNDVHERGLTLMLATGSEQQKLVYAESFAAETDGVISLNILAAPKNADAARLALTSILRHKGRVLDATSEQVNILRRRLDVEGLKLLDQLSAVRSRLATLVLTGQGDKDPNASQGEVARLEADEQRLEADISRRSGVFRAQSQSVTVEVIQKLIPVGAALVEIVAHEPMDIRDIKNYGKSEPMRYVAYVLHQEGPTLWVDLGEAAPIDVEISKLRDALRDAKRTDAKQLARSVDEKVMRPIRKLLGETRMVLLSPDGSLNLLPFSALVDEQDRYLVENYTFDYLTSGRDLLRFETQSQSRQAPVILANPKFDSAPSNSSGDTRSNTTDIANQNRDFDFAKARFRPLPGTAEEATALAALMPDAKLLTGAQATETALKQVSGPKILHIASHGFFLPDQKREPETDRNANRQLVMEEKAPGSKPVVIVNPLLRSGLALAGANLRLGGNGEDGVLTAMEASGLDLWGTKLVVLSACETGVGEVKSGQGVYGLRRALVIAGAESLVMSLWPVSDAATRDLMSDYYKRLSANESRAEALRQVQLKMLANPQTAHPFFWASFIPAGQWKSIDNMVKNTK